MHDSDLQRYKEMLLAVRERLGREISHLAESVRSVAQPVGEHDRRVSEAVDKEVLLETAEEAIYCQVRNALARVESGTFGACQGCGKPIAKTRLNAVPYAAYCIKCERSLEQAPSNGPPTNSTM